MVGKKSDSHVPPAQLPGRNDPCHCGSGKKYKKCCEEKDAQAAHATIEKQWTETSKEFEKKKEAETAEEGKVADKTGPVRKNTESVKPVVQKHQTFAAPKFNTPRKAGGGGS